MESRPGEPGATTAAAFHRAGLVDRYVVYLAPALMGGDGGPGLFAGPGAATMADLWRGRVVDLRRVGDDLRIELAPLTAPITAAPDTITGPRAVTQGAP